MYAGQPRQDFLVAAEAVRVTGIDEPLLLEVGCGSGYYSEILSYLLECSVRYLSFGTGRPHFYRKKFTVNPPLR